MTMHEPTGRSYHVIAACLGTARVEARRMARAEGHPTPDGSILYTDDLGPAPRGGRRFEIVIQEGNAR